MIPLETEAEIRRYCERTGSMADIPSIRRLVADGIALAIAQIAGEAMTGPTLREPSYPAEVRELTALQRKEAQEWIALGMHPAEYAARRHVGQVQVERAVGWEGRK